MFKYFRLNFSSLRPKLEPGNWWSRKRLRSQTVAQYSHLTSGIFFAHAVNTPLTTLTLQLEQAVTKLKAHSTLKDEQQQLLQALASAHHLQKLMKLKATTSRATVFPLKSALQEVITRLEDSESRIIASSLLVDEDTYLSGQIFLFQEALSCLITNAFEAYHRRRKKKIAVIALETGRHCLIYICDSGKGMDWLTQQLVTVHGFSRKKLGWGQGITFAKVVIEEFFRGQLLINSQSNTGTVIMIKLPLKR